MIVSPDFRMIDWDFYGSFWRSLPFALSGLFVFILITWNLNPADSIAEEDVRMISVVDDINAYSYSYPVELPSKKFVFKW